MLTNLNKSNRLLISTACRYLSRDLKNYSKFAAAAHKSSSSDGDKELSRSDVKHIKQMEQEFKEFKKHSNSSDDDSMFDKEMVKKLKAFMEEKRDHDQELFEAFQSGYISGVENEKKDVVEKLSQIVHEEDASQKRKYRNELFRELVEHEEIFEEIDHQKSTPKKPAEPTKPFAADVKTGFIGSGQMSEALIGGLVNSGTLTKDCIMSSNPSEDRRKILEGKFGIKTVQSNIEIVQNNRVVILGVKPDKIEMVLNEIKDHLTPEHFLVSIAAGKTISWMQDLVGPDIKVARFCVNTPALVSEMAGAYSLGHNCDAAHQEFS